MTTFAVVADANIALNLVCQLEHGFDMRYQLVQTANALLMLIPRPVRVMTCQCYKRS